MNSSLQTSDIKAGVQYLPDHEAFFLQAGGATYGMQVASHNVLCHAYWGAPLEAQSLAGTHDRQERCMSHNPVPGEMDFSLDTLPQEYPTYGRTDFRSPAIEVLHPETGSRIADLRTHTHRIEPGKPQLKGLPATFAEADEATTLVITMRDEAVNLVVELNYTAFAHHPVIARSARIINEGAKPITLKRALSCSLDLPASFAGYHFLHTQGAWMREMHPVSQPLRPGMQSVESRRGASSHNHNPFFALTELDAHEEYGAAYGFNLVYSGNFLAAAEVDVYGGVRCQMGLNPFDFAWELRPGESFQTPEVVMAYSGEGLGGMSRAFHRFYRHHLIAKDWQKKDRPVVINSWEATYFDFDADKIERFAEQAASLGIDLLVLDDGWFGHRNDAKSSLGDWFVNEEKLPKGLPDLVERVQAKGIDFGLWFEPEMISPDSDLFRAHPDWCLHVPTHACSEGRHQLALDLSRPEICDEVYRRVADILKCAPIRFVKWDMNRNLTEIGSPTQKPERQQETAHRYILGLYSILERLRESFPDILFEGCASGGGRFDPGILAYMPQIWTSDDSDAIARLRIQHGTSLVYPFNTISAHVSPVPNHFLGRITPLSTRCHVAMTGIYGYELDPGEMTEEEKESTRRDIEHFKKLRQLLSHGDLYRLRNPFHGNEAAWMVVSEDRREALVTHVNILSQPNPAPIYLHLRGLNPEGRYRIEGSDTILRGDFLQQAGLIVPAAKSDFTSHQWHLCQI